MKHIRKTFAMIKYLSDNFYTIEELSQATDTSTEAIEKMVEYNLIPRWTAVNWVERAKETLFVNSNNYVTAGNVTKQQMKQKFYDLFNNHKSICIGLSELYDEQENIIGCKFDEQFDFIYQNWCNGTYGICTKNPCDENNIFYKAVYQVYTDNELFQVINAAKKYDLYVSEFTPLSFDISSRKKFVNKFVN
jgi:hypothetical protein